MTGNGSPPPEAIERELTTLVEGLRRKHLSALIEVQNEATPERSAPGLRKGVMAPDDFQRND